MPSGNKLYRGNGRFVAVKWGTRLIAVGIVLLLGACGSTESGSTKTEGEQDRAKK